MVASEYFHVIIWELAWKVWAARTPELGGRLSLGVRDISQNGEALPEPSSEVRDFMGFSSLMAFLYAAQNLIHQIFKVTVIHESFYDTFELHIAKTNCSGYAHSISIAAWYKCLSRVNNWLDVTTALIIVSGHMAHTNERIIDGCDCMTIAALKPLYSAVDSSCMCDSYAWTCSQSPDLCKGYTPMTIHYYKYLSCRDAIAPRRDQYF